MKTLTIDDILRRYCDPKAPPDHSIRQGLAEHAAPGLIEDMRAMVGEGEEAPEDLEERVRDIISVILQTAPTEVEWGKPWD